MKKFLNTILFIFLALMLVGCNIYQVHEPIDKEPQYLSEEAMDTLYQELVPSVVAIRNFNFDTEIGLGSGLIYDREEINIVGREKYFYYVVTNYHVVDNGTHVKVNFSANLNDYVLGDIYSKVVVDANGEYPSNQDLAIVRFESSKAYALQEIIPYQDPSKVVSVKQTSTVFALGAPVGLTHFPDFSGYGQVRQNPSNDWIVHSASINPGNSGGPLYTTDGTFIGINTRRIEETQSGRIVVGMAYALHVNHVAKLLKEIKASMLPTFGIRYVDVFTQTDENQVKTLGYMQNETFVAVDKVDKDIKGILILDVSSTKPASVHLKKKDVIVEVNGKALEKGADLAGIIGKVELGKTYQLGLYRKGETIFEKVEVDLIITHI